MVAATDAALDRALGDEPDPEEVGRLPALLRFRARISADDSGAVTTRLLDVAQDDDAGFGARAAAVRGLGALELEPAIAALESVARTQLDAQRRDTQRGEVLGWLALSGLPESRAESTTHTLALIDADAPRLAVLGYRFAPRQANYPWLAPALKNPWPQVRQAAMQRVDAPCEGEIVRVLARQGGRSDEGGDSDRAAARAAVSALGRCGGSDATRALQRLLSDASGDMELRSEAARQLTKRGGLPGAERVAKLLASGPDRAFARRLAASLRHAPATSPKIDAALCDELQTPGPVARAAADSLRALHPERIDPCRD